MCFVPVEFPGSKQRENLREHQYVLWWNSFIAGSASFIAGVGFRSVAVGAGALVRRTRQALPQINLVFELIGVRVSEPPPRGSWLDNLQVPPVPGVLVPGSTRGVGVQVLIASFRVTLWAQTGAGSERCIKWVV